MFSNMYDDDFSPFNAVPPGVKIDAILGSAIPVECMKFGVQLTAQLFFLLGDLVVEGAR